MCLNGPASRFEKGRRGSVIKLWVYRLGSYTLSLIITQCELQYLRTLFKGACEICTFLHVTFTCQVLQCTLAQARYFGVSRGEKRLWACGTCVTYFMVASHLVGSVVSEPATFAVCLFVCLLACLLVCLFVCLFVCVFVCLFVVCLFVCLFLLRER